MIGKKQVVASLALLFITEYITVPYFASAPATRMSFPSQAHLPDTNPRGIPRARFVENLDVFLASEESADHALKKMQELYGKYKLMEGQLTQKKKALKQKIPEITKSLDSVKLLKAKKEEAEAIQTTFSLSDNVYAHAEVDPSNDAVCLWLGANVMVEYSYDEAITLLESNKTKSQQVLTITEEDLEFLKDQITTTEVNIARIYNHDVKLRRAQKAAAANASASAASSS